MTNPNIELVNENQYPVDTSRLVAAIEHVLAQEDVAPDSGVTVVITGNDDVQSLNEQFRGIDAPTDVLSFPSGDEEMEFDDAPEEAYDYLGDLVIAYPYAKAQAERESLDVEDSVILLVIHGTLHLLGYDHDTPENRAAMWAAQEKALTALGLSTDLVPPLEGVEDEEQ